MPSVLARADGSNEPDDPNAIRILKWVRTQDVATFEDTRDVTMAEDQPAPAPAPAE